MEGRKWKNLEDVEVNRRSKQFPFNLYSAPVPSNSLSQLYIILLLLALI